MTEALVGLVVVSHSVDLARAAIGLAAQMLHGAHVRIEEAAGLADGAFGTDAVRVAEALVRADAGRGVVVLMDLGSAVLSAEVALDLIDPGLRERVTLCAAPLVEGLCVAVVAAAGGADRSAVAAEARRGLAAKEEHLGVARPPRLAQGPPRGPAERPTEGSAERRAEGPTEGPAEAGGRFEITWPQGLHARPVAALVAAVRALDADVRLRNLTLGGDPVPAGSPAAVAGLGARQGDVVEVAASGPDAGTAVERLLAMAARGFGDLDARERSAADE